MLAMMCAHPLLCLQHFECECYSGLGLKMSGQELRVHNIRHSVRMSCAVFRFEHSNSSKDAKWFGMLCGNHADNCRTWKCRFDECKIENPSRHICRSSYLTHLQTGWWWWILMAVLCPHGMSRTVWPVIMARSGSINAHYSSLSPSIIRATWTLQPSLQ